MEFEEKGGMIIFSTDVNAVVGKGDLTGANFVFFDGENSEIIERKFSLNELETRVFNFTLIKLNVSEIETVSIAPFFLSDSGKELLGDVGSGRTVGSGVVSGGSGDSGDNGGDENETCTPNPNVCNDNGFVCGVADDICGTLYSCGICNVGFICNVTQTECISGTCEPDPGACGGLECGDVVNSCGDLVGCGNCDVEAGESCIDGLCVPEACTPMNVTEACGILNLTCGSTDDGCGTPLLCGTCDLGFLCSAGACVQETSINTGIVDLTWPPGVNLFFDSTNLSKTESYNGKFVKFPGSIETRCLQIIEYVLPSEPEIYDKSFARLNTPNNEKTNVSTGDNYEIWNSITCGN